MKKTNRIVIISGDSSGFGLEMVKQFINNRDIVCGISRKEFKLDKLDHYIGDISNYEDCKTIIDSIYNKYHRIDILINNAGFGIFGSIEETDILKAKQIMDVNFLGTFYLTKCVLEIFRNQKQGQIINTSSLASLIPLPYQGFYCASKAALDSLFDSLRIELLPYNIKITSIRPGDAKTSFTKNRLKDISPSSPYYESVTKCLNTISKDEQNGFSPLKVGKTALKLSFKKHPPYVKKVGAKDSFLSVIFKILPKCIAYKLIYKIYA